MAGAEASGATSSAGSRLISAIDEPPSSAKPSSPSTRSAHRRRAHVVERERLRRTAQERADRAARVLVLGLAEQQRRAALEIAQVDVVAERRADDARRSKRPPARFRARDCSIAKRVEAGVGAAAHRRHRLGLGEDLGVGADADLEILRPRRRPRPAPASAASPRASRARVDASSAPTRRGDSSARIASAAARSPRARSSITRSSSEVAKVTPAALIACRSIGASSHGRSRIAAVAAAYWRERRRSRRSARPPPRAAAAAGSAASQRSRIVAKVGADVENAPSRDDDDRRAADVRPPDPADERAGEAVGGQRRRGGQFKRRHLFLWLSAARH